MDLKDVIESVSSDASEANSAFHAGHNDTAEEHLCSIENTIGQYLRENQTPAGDVTESTTSEKPAAPSMERLAGVPGATVQPAASPAVAAAQQIGKGQADEKPTQ